MPISADFTIDYTNRRITHSSGTTRYSVNALYSYFADLIDDAAQMDDTVPMSAQTPVEYSLINGWFMDDASFGYLTGGSIQTVGWDAATYTNGVYLLTMQAGGYTNAVAGDIGKTVTDGTRSGVLLAYDNTLRKWWVRRGTATAWAGACTITTGTGAGTITGSVTTGEDVWGNFYNLGTLKTGSVLYIEQGGALIASPPGYTADAMDVLVRVRQSSTDISSRNVSLFSRNLGDDYDCFTATATASGGRNPVPISTKTDTNDSSGTASDGGITITVGTTSQDIGDGAGAQNYDVLIDGNGMTVANVYKAIKYRTRRQNTAAIGSGSSVLGQFYRTANGSYAEVKNSPFGFQAGATFFGARGVYLTNVSDPNNRSLIDAAGNVRTPPVSITVTVSGVVSGDRVLVARSAAGVINKSQFTLNGTHTAATTIVVNETVGNDIPTSGVIRVGDTRFTYGGLNRGTKTFSTLSAAVTAASGSGAYVPLIDDVAAGATIASPAMTYVADIDIIARARKYGGAGASILPFEITGTVTNAGLTVSAIRTADTIVT